jgi:putative transposon-encoded protein
MVRYIKAIKGGKLVIKDDVEEIYEKRITPYGNGAKIDSMKKYIGRRAFVMILKGRPRGD